VWAGVMGNDLSPRSYFNTALAEAAEMKEGEAKLLINSERQHDGIALLWSPSSVHLTRLTGSVSAADDYDSTAALIHDLGLEFRTVAYEQLAQGSVTSSEFRVLLLPFSQALSQAEIEAIRTFVSGGGTVIADMRPAVRDEHGKFYSTRTSSLDGLFGVTNTEPLTVRKKSLLANNHVVVNGNAVNVGFPLWLDYGVAVSTGGVAAGSFTDQSKPTEAPVPIVVSKTAGSGRAILLNFSVAEYIAQRAADKTAKPSEDFPEWPAGDGVRRIMRDLFSQAGIESQVSMTPEQPAIDVSRFRSGEIQYVGVLQKLPRDPMQFTLPTKPPIQSKTVALNLPKMTNGQSLFIYDVRAGKYLGQTSKLTDVNLTPGVAQLYALMPYKPSGIGLSGLPPTATQGDTPAFTVRLTVGATSGVHCIRVVVRNPSGAAQKPYVMNLLTDSQGEARGTIPLALNDPTGRWTVSAREVVTGMSASASFMVLQR
jgi:hypothetical protein